MCDSKNRHFRESGMLFLSIPTITSARKCAHNCYLKLIFQSCSSRKIFIYLELLHWIPLDNFYAWKKSGSSIQHVLYLKQKKNPTQTEWLFKNTDLEKETLFLSRPGKWWSNSLVGYLSCNQKKLPVMLFHAFCRSVCGISLVDFMMQHPSGKEIPASHPQHALYVMWTCRAQKLHTVFTEQDVHLLTQPCHQELYIKVQVDYQF